MGWYEPIQFLRVRMLLPVDRHLCAGLWGCISTRAAVRIAAYSSAVSTFGTRLGLFGCEVSFSGCRSRSPCRTPNANTRLNVVFE